MGNGEQIFKANTYQWFLMFRAYSNGDLAQAHARYLEFQKKMKEANSAIRAANIEGVGTISENPSDIDIINLHTRQTKLKDFAYSIYGEADELIDDPFFQSMSELLGDIIDHSKFQVNYNGEVNSIEYDECGPEYIDKLFQSLIESNDKDSKELTGDPKVDEWVKKYSTYDPSSGKYGFEKENALTNDKWDTLPSEKKEALRHMYEYNFRLMERNFNANTKEGKASQDILNRMNNYFFEKKYSYNNEITATNSAKGLLSLMDKKAHSHEMLETIAEKHAWFQAPIYSKDAHGNDTNYQLMGNKISLRYEYDKAGISLVFKNEYRENGTTQYSKDYEIGYYTSLSRCIDYVKYQEKLDPECYQHQKELGLTTNLVADFLLAADSSKDMQFIDNMTKNKGESYDKIFVGNPEGMTVSGWGAIVLYNSILSERWYKFNDEAARQEAARMNEFLREGNTEYAGDCYSYYNTAMYQMQTGDLDIESDMSALDAYLIGLKSEFITWPTAINAMFECANEMNISYMPMDEVSKINSVGYDYEENPRLYDEIRFGMLEGKTLQQRLSCYKYVGENRDRLGVTLNDAALKDLRNIYFSYLKYAENRAINLYSSKKDQTILDELYYILYNNDSTFKKSEDYRRDQSKVAEASAQHPVALFLGKASGDVIIYGGFSAATAGLGGGLEQALGGFTSRVISGTAADIIIKDLPKAITSYMQGEEFADVANEFACEVMLDAIANIGGEAVGGAIKKATDAINTKIGKDYADSFMGAPNKSEFLKNLSNENLTKMVAQMDGKAAAKVLENFDDDGIKAVLNGLSPEKSKYILDELLNSSNAVKVESLSKAFAPEGPSFSEKLTKIVTEKKDAERLATEIRNKAKNAEPQTTQIMKSLEGNGGHLEGLEYRLKSQESLSRKIISDSHNKDISLDEAASEIGDSLRYTMVYDEAVYTKNVDESLNHLREQGYVVEKLKNYWGNEEYQGINVSVTSPDGVKVELQFHTDASYYTKEYLNHSHYEVARSEFASEAQKKAAQKIMKENQLNVQAPKGVKSIGRQIEITPEAKIAKTEVVQQASRINKKLAVSNISENVAVEANKEATEAINKVGKKLGYSDKVLEDYSKKIEDIEYEYYENGLKNARKDWNTPVSEQEVIAYRRTQISDAKYYKGLAEKKLKGMDAILQYKDRFDAGAFDGYSLDEILDFKINKNAPVKDYSTIMHGEYLPTVDAFISDNQVISHMKEALPNNASIQKCTTLQELADVLHKERPEIELVVFQSKASKARNIEYFNGSFGNGSLGFREGGVYSVPKYKLNEYAENYSDLCGLNNGTFEVYDYEKFGKEVLSGVDLKNTDGAYMIETKVPINGGNIGMPSVNNCCAYMDEFVSGGYLRVKPEIELTQKQLNVDLKKGFGKDKGVKYKIHVLDGNVSKTSLNGVANANASNVSNNVSVKSSVNVSTAKAPNNISVLSMNSNATMTSKASNSVNATSKGANNRIVINKAGQVHNARIVRKSSQAPIPRVINKASSGAGVANINGAANTAKVYNRVDAASRICSSKAPAKEYSDIVRQEIYSNKNLSPKQMVQEEMALFYSLPNGKRPDINPVNNYKAVKTDAKSLQDGINKGYLPISWHSHHGLDESKPILGIYNSDGSCNLPDIVCRRGSEYGNNLSCPKKDGTLPSLNEIAVPYAENVEAIHVYNVDSDTYKEVVDLIAGADRWNATDLDKRVAAINDIIDKMNNKHKLAPKQDSINTADLIKYKRQYVDFQRSNDSKMCRSGIWDTDTKYGVAGTVAPMHVDDMAYKEKLYDGGAPQFNTPMPINVFIRLGAMWEEL